MAKTKVKVSVTGKDSSVKVNEYAPHPAPPHPGAIGDFVEQTVVDAGEHVTIELGDKTSTVIITE